MTRPLLVLALVAISVVGSASDARAYCRRTTSAWSGRPAIRVVIHPEMQEFIRHPFINPVSGVGDDLFACTTSSQCGADGLCASGYDPMSGPTSRCRGRRWTRSEIERAVLWAVGRINNETPAGIPFMYVDLNDTHTCQIDEVCDDADRPWMNCFQHDTIVILPSECDRTSLIGAVWTGSQWIDSAAAGSTHQMIRVGWSGSPRGISWEFDAAHSAGNLPTTLLHEIGHGLGLGHLFHEGINTDVCVPDVVPAPGMIHPQCPTGAFGTCAVMHSDSGLFAGAGLNQHYYGLDDIEGLVALFGLDSMPDTRLYEDCDISTPSFVEWPTADLPLVTDVAAAPSFPLSGAGTLAIGGRLRDPLYQERFQLWEWNYSTLSTTLVASVDTPGFRSTGALGVSVSPTHRALSTLPVRLSGNARHWRRQVRLVRREIVGGGQTSGTLNPSSGTPADTPTPGVASAYYAPLDAWMHALRDANGQVLLVAWRPLYGWSNVIATNIRSFAPPSIACSSTRCFVALVETPSPLPGASTSTRLQWTEGAFAFSAGGSLVYDSPGMSSVETSWFNVLSDPVASAVLKPDGTWYFYVATSWPQFVGGSWGTRLLTYRHAQNTTGSSSLVQMTPLLEHSPGVAVQPTAAGTGSCAELFSWRSP